MTEAPFTRATLNGIEADAAAWRALASTSYGHFTAMQVRDGAVADLDLHFERLQSATRELFGHDLDIDRVRGWLRKAVEGAPTALSVRISVFSRAFQRDRPAEPAQPDVLIAAAPARIIATTPLRVATARYQREAPHIKHLGTFGLFHQKRLAQQRGYDDVLFVGPDGLVSEGSIWNVGFFDDDGIVWPQAPQLRGISMQVLQQGLEVCGVASTTRPVALDELPRFRGAFFTNSSVVAVPIVVIDDIAFPFNDFALMLRAFDAVPVQHV